jgi:hypothetical protein
MAYIIGMLPAEAPEWLRRELRAISESISGRVPYVVLDTQHTAPKKLVEGMTLLADGTNWNPGSGAGVYTYRGGAWRFLG